MNWFKKKSSRDSLQRCLCDCNFHIPLPVISGSKPTTQDNLNPYMTWIHDAQYEKECIHEDGLKKEGISKNYYMMLPTDKVNEWAWKLIGTERKDQQ